MGGFDGFRGKFLFGEIREGRAGFNRAISLEITRGGDVRSRGTGNTEIAAN